MRYPGLADRVRYLALAVALAGLVIPLAGADAAAPPERKTAASIEGQAFHVNGRPTYAGRSYRGMKVEGLLLNARLVQGIFDDANPETRKNWDYPDGPWDADRNTREFVAAMPAWRAHGLISFTINLQGGSPRGYSRQEEQVWLNSAFNPDGSLRPAYMARLALILDRADELGMAPIVGLFYFGQEHRLDGEAATVRAADNAVDWLVGRGYRNVLIEITNECNNSNYHKVLQPGRAHELIERVKQRSAGKLDAPAKRLLVSTSFGGGTVPPDNVIAAADFVLLHGNGVRQPDGIRRMVERTRGSAAYRGQPVLFNEDDHFDFDRPDNNMLAAIGSYAGWGYFDYRMKGEGFADGYQSPPVDWQINSPRKKGFFDLLAKVTGEEPQPRSGDKR